MIVEMVLWDGDLWSTYLMLCTNFLIHASGDADPDRIDANGDVTTLRTFFDSLNWSDRHPRLAFVMISAAFRFIQPLTGNSRLQSGFLFCSW